MKRAIGILIGLAVAAATLAQAPFTIVRPADGSRVREKVKVQIPKNSVPNGGYIGIFVGGKFVEALIPNARGNFYEYTLDTKGRRIPDGNLKIEAVLYMDSEAAAPKILDRSSVNVRVQNSASIKVPGSGLLLRYGMQPGQELVYKEISRTSTSILSDADVRNPSSRTQELPLDYSVTRLLYSVDNRYSNGDLLLRMQAIPPRGKNYLYYNAVLEGESPEQKLYMEEDLGSLYMRVNNRGGEVFTSFPTYYPIEGSPASDSFQLYVVRPLPTLPDKRVKPGDTWKGWFQFPSMPDMLREASTVIRPLEARGEFLGVEWEMGRPCAKIRKVITASSRTFAGMRFASDSKGADERVQFEEISWFALDKKILIKSVLNLTIDRKVPQQQQAQGGSGQPGAPGSGGPSIGGANSGGGGRAGGGRLGGDDDIRQGGRRGGPDAPPGGQGGGLQMGGGGQGRGGPGTGGMQRGPSGGGSQWQRVRAQLIVVIEK